MTGDKRDPQVPDAHAHRAGIPMRAFRMVRDVWSEQTSRPSAGGWKPLSARRYVIRRCTKKLVDPAMSRLVRRPPSFAAASAQISRVGKTESGGDGHCSSTPSAEDLIMFEAAMTRHQLTNFGRSHRRLPAGRSGHHNRISANLPAKPILKLINNFSGRPSDFLARTIGEYITSTSKQQPVITDNRAGAGGSLGAEVVAKSAADGHTILVGIDTTLTVNPHLYAALPFRPTTWSR